MADPISSLQAAPRLSTLVPAFLDFVRVERGFAKASLLKYSDCLRQVARRLGDRPVSEYGKADVLALKAEMLERGLSVSRQVSILFAFKRLLAFCRDEHGLTALDPELITAPRRPRREVLYLKAPELEKFVGAIKLTSHQGHAYVPGLRFRALVEMLLGSAMRIGELLSLDQRQIDFASREAKIIGKAGKERTVFFTDRALLWLQRYLDVRTDDHPAVFMCLNGRVRLTQADIWRTFAKTRARAGLTKPVRPHLLRHTAATQLLFNGCPIGHIKEILGHERLETTCRYYLGLDHTAAKAAHHTFLIYPTSESLGSGADSAQS